MAHKQTAAIARAKKWVGDSYPAGWCQKWVVTEIFASGGVGDWDGNGRASAIDGWKAARKKVAVTLANAKSIPAGYPIYFSGGKDGHAAVSAGNGKMWSTDLPTTGKVGLVDISAAKTRWGYTLSGYVIVDGHGNDFSDPVAKPTPKPTPAPAGPTVTSTSLNAGSYNAHGAKTYKTRTDKYVNRRRKSEVDVINLQEVGNGANVKSKPNCFMRGRLDRGFGDLYRRHIGADGRYCYSNPGRVKPIKSGVIVAAKSSWYRKDDKQASYLVFEKSGVKGMDVSFHLESEDGSLADTKRVDQMLSIVGQALVIAKAQGVDIRNILFTGDTNSAGKVARAMAAAGWRNVAAGGKYENRHTYMGWDGKARERFDYGFVHKSAGPAFMNVIHEDTDVSDHAELVIKRTLTK